MAYREICVAPRCGEKTVARLSDPDNSRRVDLCLGHALATAYEHENEIVIVDAWNGFTIESIKQGVEQRKKMTQNG